MRFLFLLFLIMPILEVMVLLQVAESVGWLSTIALVVLTAIVGINILKHQGLSTLTRANQRLESGELPAREILEGFCLAIGGALLLTPGFITDTMGFLLLIGPTRRALVDYLIRSGRVNMQGGMKGGIRGGSRGFSFFHYESRRYGKGKPQPGPGDVLEGEYTREQPENRRLKPDDES